MATGYANCVLGSDGCDLLQHILTSPRTIQSVKRIAPVNKTPITELVSLESIFLAVFVPFWPFFVPFGYFLPLWAICILFFRCVFFSLFGTVLKPSKERCQISEIALILVIFISDLVL